MTRNGRRIRGASTGWPILPAIGTSGHTTPARAPAKGGSGIRTVLLVRHGAYDESDPHSQAETHSLTAVGREQARLTGKRLAALPGGVDQVYASPVARALGTAEIACRDLAPLRPFLDTDLAEGPLPVTGADGKPKQVTAEEQDCRERLERVFARYFRPPADGNTTVILFCHGNVIRYLWGRALGIDPGIWERYQVSNSGVTEIRVKSDGSMIGVSYNDVGHLPPELRTFSRRSPMYQHD